jgi:hypothetical protein
LTGDRRQEVEYTPEKNSKRKFGIIFLLLILLTSMGWSTGKYDLNQKDVYEYTDYTSTKSLSVLILLNVKDMRPSGEKTGGVLEDQMVDADWKRPMDVMVADLMNKEMQKAGITKLIQVTPENADYKLEIDILSFYGGTKESDSGGSVKRWFVPRLAKGVARFQIILKDKKGKEIVNVEYTGTSQQEMARMTNYHRGSIKNAGLSLREVVSQILNELDSAQLHPQE